jgi:RNA-directed DNA polymerase
MYVHVCKMETFSMAYEMAKRNNRAPGIDGVRFAAIEARGVMDFLLQIQNELKQRTKVASSRCWKSSWAR